MKPFLIFCGVLVSVFPFLLGSPAKNSLMDAYLNFEPEDMNSDEFGQGQADKTTNCSCGWTNKARIVGGKETLKNEYPLMAGLLHRGTRQIICGGSIITERHVLSAAHCVLEDPDIPKSIIVGEHDMIEDLSTSGAQIIDVRESIYHENYDPETYHYDIALFFLEEKIKFTQLVGPVCLPSKRTDTVHEYVLAVGWGRTFKDGPQSDVLLKVNLRVIPLDVCVKDYIRPIEQENPHQLCTFMRSPKHNKAFDTCQGDSGGPILWLDPETNRYTLVALVSFGKYCGYKNPAVTTDVSFFLDWIQEKVAATDGSVQTCAKV